MSAYRRILQRASEAPDGETPTYLEVKEGPDEFWLVLLYSYDSWPRILSAHRTRDIAIEYAVKLDPDKLGSLPFIELQW